MLIKSARFVTSLNCLKPFEGRGLPEIAMAGKSNVGKSSAINRLCARKGLARTSSEPGKTRLINIYNLNESFLLVDLPGYGFARAPKSERDSWAGMIEGYLSGSEKLLHVLQLVDARHEPSREDCMMVEYLRHYGLDFTVVMNKCDKLSRAQLSRQIPIICRALVVQPWQLMKFSAEDGTGREELLERIETALSAKKTPPEPNSILP